MPRERKRNVRTSRAGATPTDDRPFGLVQCVKRVLPVAPSRRPSSLGQLVELAERRRAGPRQAGGHMPVRSAPCGPRRSSRKGLGGAPLGCQLAARAGRGSGRYGGFTPRPSPAGASPWVARRWSSGAAVLALAATPGSDRNEPRLSTTRVCTEWHCGAVHASTVGPSARTGPTSLRSSHLLPPQLPRRRSRGTCLLARRRADRPSAGARHRVPEGRSPVDVETRKGIRAWG